MRARTDTDARRRATIPGIGVLHATALVPAIGNAQTSPRGRDVAAWLGRVPPQATTGGTPQEGWQQIPQAADPRRGAAMSSLSQSATPLGGWLRGLLPRAHRNVAVVALVNKLARIAWVVLRRRSVRRQCPERSVIEIGRRAHPIRRSLPCSSSVCRVLSLERRGIGPELARSPSTSSVYPITETNPPQRDWIGSSML